MSHRIVLPRWNPNPRADRAVSATVDGSGIAGALAEPVAPEPLARVAPKLARQMLKSFCVYVVSRPLRQTT